MRLKELEFKYEQKNRRITALVFESGSIVITGSPTIECARNAFRIVFEKLQPYLSIHNLTPRFVIQDDANRKKMINSEVKRRELEEKKKDGEKEKENAGVLSSKPKVVPKKTTLVVEELVNNSVEKRFKNGRNVSVPASKPRPPTSSLKSNMFCDVCYNLCDPREIGQTLCCYCISKTKLGFEMCGLCRKTSQFYENPTSRIL
jgi:hypothetical protein